jgi:DNA-binding PadR family transcriptional regulator
MSDKHAVMPLFLLALVSRGGLNTLYALQHQAGLQPGGVQPVLRQLECDGLLQRSEEGKRRRRVMKVTKEGEASLAARWQDCLSNYPDVESVLRAATIALMMDGQRSAANYLSYVANDYERRSSGVHTGSLDFRASFLDCYASMRAQWEKVRLQSAAQALRNIARTLEAPMEVRSAANMPPTG